ncbi:04896fbf-e66b-4b7f-9198-e9ec3e4f3657-CDS [Sclerotinia trifoliorum]|uniref:04896fbf-e66b-4b7f-9198-e9ec3e4f3657-CDS n=1 Tax=Sclerotinia trifoliorum TaxID=28548 RepID=A0A8H2VNH5_9HELO|nr:04896fbf-e66b-4b7f-9198-e9ec3e4f3657-CDS [Sclerotinia trifoliorum]
MSLTVKHLNNDASFLLTFAPISPFPPSPSRLEDSFTILFDPWLSGPSKIFHSKFSISHLKTPSCISSLSEIPEPDLVIISQDKTDHCHEETLKQLSSNSSKTLILAEPGAAKTIKRWKYFSSSKVIPLKRWEDPRLRQSDNILRIPVPSQSHNGIPGEVTIAFLPQKNDLTGLHNAIGITYRPPTHTISFTNPSETNYATPPSSPHSFASTLSNPTDRALSVIFSPHGCTYRTIAPYATSHLISEAALPLTSLLHPFDRISNPWYLGGNIISGFPGGVSIAQNLCAKTWISAHDGEKTNAGVATWSIRSRKWEREEVESVVSPRGEKFSEKGGIGTEVLVLGSGEGVRLVQGSYGFGGGSGVRIEREGLGPGLGNTNLEINKEVDG